MSKPSLILVGGGGHCRSVIDIVRAAGGYHIAGILDRPENIGRSVAGCEVIGADNMIGELARKGCHFLVTAGQVGRSNLRKELFDAIRNAGGTLATVVSPQAYVAADAELGEGTTIGHGAVVNSGARVGMNCIVNTGSVVEHDATVEAHSHVATGAIINGGCHVGASSLIGSRAVLLQAVRIGSECVVGAGAVVLRDVPNGRTVVGVPATTLDK